VISEGRAREIAAEFLQTSSTSWESEVVIVWAEVRIEGRFLIAPYESVRFMETGDMSEELYGNLPILVDMHTGLPRFASREELGF
jgi:hypothetical protein